MNITPITIIAPTQEIQQCVDVIQLEKAYGLNNIVTGLFYQKIISNLFWFFIIAVFLLNIAFIYYHKRQQKDKIFSKGFNKNDRILLTISFLFLIGTNAMIIFLRTFAFGDNILMLIPYILLWGINFLMLFYNFMMFFLPIGLQLINKIRRNN